MDESLLGVIAMPQEEMARSKPSATQATTSKVGQTKGDMAEVSLEVMVMEQGPTSALPTSSATEETIHVEVSR
jgi:hypothetical protein